MYVMFHGQFNKVSLIFLSFSAFRKNRGDVTLFLFRSSLSEFSLSLCALFRLGCIFFFFSRRFLARFQFSRRIAFCFFVPPQNRIGLDLDFRLRMTRQLTIFYFILSLSFLYLVIQDYYYFLISFDFYKYI